MCTKFWGLQVTVERKSYKFALYCAVFPSRDVLLALHHTAKPLSKRFWPSGSPIILVFFLTPAPIPNSKGNSVSRGAKYTWVGNFAIFDWNRRLSRKLCNIGYYVTLIGSHRWRIDSCRFWWPWVTPNPGFKFFNRVEPAQDHALTLRASISHLPELWCKRGRPRKTWKEVDRDMDDLHLKPGVMMLWIVGKLVKGIGTTVFTVIVKVMPWAENELYFLAPSHSV